MGRCYVVTGGTGFIGSHLTEALLQRGDEVIVLDDLSTGAMANLRVVHDHPRLRVVIGRPFAPRARRWVIEFVSSAGAPTSRRSTRRATSCC